MQEETRHAPNRFTAIALSFELGLGVLAAVLGWLTGHAPLETLAGQSARALLTAGLVGTGLALPAFAAVVLMDRFPVGPFRQLRRTVRRDLVPLFRGTGLLGLAAISLAAGFGEELLFRGFFQTALAAWVGPPWGCWSALLAASLAFGCCHWLSTTYAVLATLMGIYLGSMFWLSGSLAAPVAAHAAYDFLVLLYLVRWTSVDRRA